MTAGADVVLFDLGRVLVNWDPRNLYSTMFDDHAAMERFLAEVCTMEWHAAHDAGVSMAENAEPLITAHPHFEAEIRAWETRWDDMFAGPIVGAAALLERLHAAGRPLFALSNLPAEKKTHILETFPFMERFRDVIVSGEEGVIKPDPRIYDITVDRLGVAPERIFFVDDSAPNVDAARQARFDAVVFTTPDALERDLNARGLLDRVSHEPTS